MNVAKPMEMGMTYPNVVHKDGTSLTEAKDMGTGTDEDISLCTPCLPECSLLEVNVEGPGPGPFTIKGPANSPGGITDAKSEAGYGSIPNTLSLSLALNEETDLEIPIPERFLSSL